MNPRLRMVLLKCRAANMPGDNVDRAVKRATGGDDSVVYEELTYEIFGPGGVALLVELTTDNRNRTSAEIRSLLTKSGGTMASSGAVARLFHRKGQIVVPREAIGEDALMELALEAGAEDFKAEPEGYEILTAPAQFEAVHKALEAKGVKPAMAAVTEVPTLTVPLTAPETAAAVTKLIDALEDHEDVKEVYSNAEFPEG